MPVGVPLQAVRDVEAACQTLLSQGGRVCTAGLAQLLTRLGYNVHLRESLGGGVGSQCLRNLRHSCLVLEPQQAAPEWEPQQAAPEGSHSPNNNSPSNSSSIIVDPTFRDQFAIAHPSPRYAAVLEALPAVFVGPTSKIQPLVELLCAEMSLAFHSMGIVLPPWRYTKSMLSKWQPRRSVDLSLPAAAAGPAASTAATPATAGDAFCKQAVGQHQFQPRQTAGMTASSASVAAVPVSCGGRSSVLHDCQLTGSGGSSSAATHLTGSNGSSSSDNRQQGSQLLAAHTLLYGPELQLRGSADDAAPASIVGSGSGSGRHQLPAVLRQLSGTCGVPVICDAVPVKRQTSFEPLQRVVGGFAASLTAQSPLVL